MTEKIIFLVRSGAIFKISFGHLYRCLIICNELRKIKKFNPLFITNKDPITKKILDNHKIKNISLKKFENHYLIKEIIESGAKKIIIDTYDFVNPQFITFLKKKKIKSILIDDFPKKKISSDIIYNYSIINKLKKKYYGYKKIFYGTKYFFSKSIVKDFYRRDIKNILVFFGGSDIKNFSQKVMLNLKKLQVKNKITLVLGPGNSKKKYLYLKKKYLFNKKIKIKYFVKNIDNEIKNNDVIITSCGLNMYKSMANKKLCLVIPTSPHEDKISKYVMELNLGFVLKKNLSNLKKVLFNLINQKPSIKIIRCQLSKFFGKSKFDDFLKSI